MVDRKVNVIRPKGKPLKGIIVNIADDIKEVAVGRENRQTYNSKTSRFEFKPIFDKVVEHVTVKIGKDERVFIADDSGVYRDQTEYLEILEFDINDFIENKDPVADEEVDNKEKDA